MALVKMSPGITALTIGVGRVVPMLDRHHPVSPAHQLAGQRHGERGFPRVFSADYGDDAR
jgi:hypothetical protein